jgi:hypothetical protein
VLFAFVRFLRAAQLMNDRWLAQKQLTQKIHKICSAITGPKTLNADQSHRT